ncbi:MAG TPA: serine/threonine-protein kinase [Candidatus Krumholzibacteria bacterium]|nr:serine/threonine-protein kinase [Candidatus Krumholzibacteria bacterium]
MEHAESGEDGALQRLAEAVADGALLDWAAAGTEAPELAGELDNLRAIESIARLCRQVGEGDPAPAGDEIATAAAPTHWGPLVVHERLGAGAFAEVFRATETQLRREVALKLFRAERVPPGRGREDFLDEARRLAQIRHSNVIVVHGADVHGGRAGLWTELLRGETLEQGLERRGPCSAEEAALVGGELCAALAALHAAGLVHGDVTARNVMRVDGGRIVLMDFGSVREDLPEVDAATYRTGTPLTMAPEVLHGDRPTRAADIYQLGVFLYRLVSRSYPVLAEAVEELKAKHERGESVPLRDRRADLPAAFVQVVERALETDPARRFGSMGEMERALRATLGGAAGRRWSSRRWQAATALFLLAGLAVFALHPWSRTGLLATPLRVQTSLYAVQGGTQQALSPGSRLRPGEALFMTVESREDLHVYVLNEAASEPGVLNALFPDPGLQLHNPLPGGVLHRLPAASAQEAFWQASPTGGTEKLLVVASRHEIERLEELIALQQQQAALVPPVDAAVLDDLQLRAIRLQKAPQAGASAMDGLVRQLEARRERSKDLWFQLIELEAESAKAASAAP